MLKARFEHAPLPAGKELAGDFLEAQQVSAAKSLSSSTRRRKFPTYQQRLAAKLLNSQKGPRPTRGSLQASPLALQGSVQAAPPTVQGAYRKGQNPARPGPHDVRFVLTCFWLRFSSPPLCGEVKVKRVTCNCHAYTKYHQVKLHV